METVFSVRNIPERRSRSPCSSRSGSRERGDPTERTPLTHEDNEHYGAQGPYTEAAREHGDQKVMKDDGAVSWWALQFLLVVPIPAVLAAHIANILMDSMSQTLSDGSSKTFGRRKQIV